MLLRVQSAPPTIFFFFKDPPPTEISPLPLHDALPIYLAGLDGEIGVEHADGLARALQDLLFAQALLDEVECGLGVVPEHLEHMIDDDLLGHCGVLLLGEMEHSPASSTGEDAGAQAKNEALMPFAAEDCRPPLLGFKQVRKHPRRLGWHAKRCARARSREQPAARRAVSQSGIVAEDQPARCPTTSGPSFGPVDGAVPGAQRSAGVYRQAVKTVPMTCLAGCKEAEII